MAKIRRKRYPKSSNQNFYYNKINQMNLDIDMWVLDTNESIN